MSNEVKIIIINNKSSNLNMLFIAYNINKKVMKLKIQKSQYQSMKESS